MLSYYHTIILPVVFRAGRGKNLKSHDLRDHTCRLCFLLLYFL